MESDFTIVVKAGGRECFHEYASQGTELEIEYQVIEGGDLDVNFILHGPNGRVIITEHRKQDGLHKISAKEAGIYMLCLDNTFSRFAKKSVFLEVLTEEPDPEWKKGEDELFAQYEIDEGQYEIKLEDIRNAANRMKKNLDKSRQMQKQLRNYETKDRSRQEDNFTRVNTWSVIQLAVMMTVGFIQVIMIRSLFEDKSKVSKILKMKT